MELHGEGREIKSAVYRHCSEKHKGNNDLIEIAWGDSHHLRERRGAHWCGRGSTRRRCDTIVQCEHDLKTQDAMSLTQKGEVQCYVAVTGGMCKVD
jgi:hypothetical protein